MSQHSMLHRRLYIGHQWTSFVVDLGLADLQSTDDILLSDPEMGWHAIKEMTIVGKEFAYVPPSVLHSKKVVEYVVGVSSLHASSVPLTERNLDHFGLLKDGSSHDICSKGLKNKCWRVKWERRRMVVDDDMALWSILDLLGKTMVGCLSRKTIIPPSLQSWINE
jgi:hypothetical protein